MICWACTTYALVHGYSWGPHPCKVYNGGSSGYVGVCAKMKSHPTAHRHTVIFHAWCSASWLLLLLAALKACSMGSSPGSDVEISPLSGRTAIL